MNTVEIKLGPVMTLLVTASRAGGHRIDMRVATARGNEVLPCLVLDAKESAALADALTPAGELSLRDQLEVCQRSSKILARTAVKIAAGFPEEQAEAEVPLVEIGQGDYARRIMP